MIETTRCPRCGAHLADDAPAGLCPKCLVQAGFQSEVEPQPSVGGSDPVVVPTLQSPAGSGTGFAPPSLEELAPRFPQLELLELVGKGGMGAVYKARQRGLDRLVAIKILPPEIGHDAAFAERFTREARALARLSHNHIVSVYDFGQSDGLFYIVMEYIDGVNLRQTIQTGTLTSQEALAIVPQICEALQLAHDEGIVHRDIKPENILIDKRGRVKIADFGLAKLLGQDAGEHLLTATHQVMGTPRYMAPEQMQGSREVDHRADIYSLGVIFYELLTGELPMGKFAPPSKRVQVDVRLDEIVLRALEQQPEQRYQHASEVKTDVEAISRSPGVPHPEPVKEAAAGTAAEPRFSRFAFAGLVWALFGLLAVIPTLFFIELNRVWNGTALPTDLVHKQPPFPFLVFMMVLLAIGAGAPIGTTIFGALAIGHIKRSGGRTIGLPLAVVDAFFFPVLILGLAASALTHIAQIIIWTRTHTGYVYEAGGLADIIAPDSANRPDVFFLVLDAIAALVVCFFAGRAAWRAIAGGRDLGASSNPKSARISRKATALVAAGTVAVLLTAIIVLGLVANTIRFGDRPSDQGRDIGAVARTAKAGTAETPLKIEELFTLKGHTGYIYNVRFSPDGTRIASASHDGTAKVWNAETGEELFTCRGHTDYVHGLAYSSDGTRLATCSQDGSARIWDAATGEEKLRVTDRGVSNLAFSPNGERVASAGHQNKVMVWNSETGEEILTPKGDDNSIFFNVAYSPDGKWLAASGMDGALWLWDAATGREADVHANAISNMRGLAFDRESKRIAACTADGLVRVWDVLTGELLVLIALDDDWPMSVTFSSDGQWLAGGTSSGAIKLWDTTTAEGGRVWSEQESGRRVLAIQAHPRWVRSVAFNSDGTRLASASDDKSVKVWKVTLAAGASGSTNRKAANAATDEGSQLQGVWLAVAGERNGGQPLSAEETSGVKLTFDGNQMRVVMQGRNDEGTFKLDLSQHPKRIAVTRVEGPNRFGVMDGIYELDGDHLRICMGEPEDRPTEFKTKAGSRLIALDLVRATAVGPIAFEAVTGQFVQTGTLVIDRLGKFEVTYPRPFAGSPTFIFPREQFTGPGRLAVEQSTSTGFTIDVNDAAFAPDQPVRIGWLAIGAAAKVAPD